MSRGNRPPLQQQSQVTRSPSPSPYKSVAADRESLSRNTSLETRSRSPSPNPIPTATSPYEYYGTANLTDRSRSPSPTTSLPEEGGRTVSRRQPVVTPQKPALLSLSVRRADNNMPHVLPSPTIPQPHKSPGSINFPRLSASPSHGLYEVDWTRPCGDVSATHTPNLPRSASSQQLGRTWNGSLMRIDRNRSHFPSQILHPSPNLCHVSPLPSTHGHHARRGLGHQVEMDDIFSQKPDAFGGRSRGGTSTLPRTYRSSEQTTLRNGERGVAGTHKTSSTPFKDKGKEQHSDSEDEDWC